ncbi:hypothetical protein SAMN04488498_12564 [Mesorhizobium albiziae]|uniref:Gamma-glutamylcyclotransferase n=1 Tax=Neomesorhizobium albiziae TaxID=335020 RepID=A0A1I4EFK0_9HYPH|nr:hypothetical protein [Mesorhizobium albiziae]GLS33497.1 hypothetical protein GCM10007937_52090 [Mesorhizobium albiziae]SFL03989.1 hypothetical protein SAMN04488498_12564 [Mesorhizobium albiziae]
MPPDHPLPPDKLGRYSPERDFYAEKDIADYVEGQARDETVQNVERVKTEYVMGEPYEIWDVSTDKDRWWVITNMTNLYSQRHFPSLDYTLSFHVGLMMRVASRDDRAGDGEPTPFDEVFRRQNQAADLLERAVEAVDFQAVGMQLRECLISLVAAARRRVEVTDKADRPKDADVVGWNRLIVSSLCPGAKNDELRNYLKAITEKAWPLVNWLTHHRNASKTSALVALDAVDAIIKHYARLLSRERADHIEQCPRCQSRNVRTFFDIAIEPDGEYFQACGECDWDSHPGIADDDEPEDDGGQAA